MKKIVIVLLVVLVLLALAVPALAGSGLVALPTVDPAWLEALHQGMP